jgi:hypothetical protein
MAAHHHKLQIEAQPIAEHLEREPDVKNQHEVLLKSTLDKLGLWATVKRFKKVKHHDARVENRLLTGAFKAVIVCNLLCIAAAADGYQYTLNG